MVRKKETLQTVIFYVALESTKKIYEYSFTASDFLDNLQVKQEDDNMFYTAIPQDYRKIYLRNNFQVNDAVFGSPIGVCFIYQNGEKEWAKRVDAQSSNSKNISTMIGNWMQDKTYEQWRSNINFKGHPYIGKAENAIIVTMGYFEEPGITPPPVIEDTIPEPPEEPEPPEPEPIEVIPSPKPMEFTFSPGEETVKEPMLANLILRNARMRGPRESYKELMAHEELTYDMRILQSVFYYFEGVHRDFVNAVHGINVEDKSSLAKRHPSSFEMKMMGIDGALSDYRMFHECCKQIKLIEERIDAIGEEYKNYARNEI